MKVLRGSSRPAWQVPSSDAARSLAGGVVTASLLFSGNLTANQVPSSGSPFPPGHPGAAPLELVPADAATLQPANDPASATPAQHSLGMVSDPSGAELLPALPSEAGVDVSLFAPAGLDSAVDPAGDLLMPAGDMASGDAAGDLSVAALEGVQDTVVDPKQQLQAPSPRPWTFSVNAGIIYDDNILFSGPGDTVPQQGDYILNAGFGGSYSLPGGSMLRSLTLTGSASYMHYLEQEDLSGWNFNVGLNASQEFGDLVVNVGLFANQANSADRWVGGFATRRNYGANIDAFYSLTGKVRLTGGMGWAMMDFDSYLLNTISWNFYAGMDYAVTEKTRLGANYMWSWMDQDFSTQQGWGSVNLTAAWQATAKTGFSTSIGHMVGGLDGSAGADGPGWLWSLGANWQATDRTNVSLTGSRNLTGNPVGNNEVINFTTVALTVGHRFSDRLSASVGTSYQFDAYEATETGIQDGRQDNWWTLNASLSWQIMPRTALNAFYEYRNNASNTTGADFDANRYGLSMSYSF